MSFMFRTLFLLLILLSFDSAAGYSALAEPPRSYSYYLDEALTALNSKEYEKAINALKQAHRVSPSARYPLEKIKVIERLIKKQNQTDTGNAEERLRLYEYYAGLGEKAFERGDYRKASEHFHTAARMIPDGRKAGQYINLIKRMDEGRVVNVSAQVLPEKQEQPVKETTKPQGKAAVSTPNTAPQHQGTGTAQPKPGTVQYAAGIKKEERRTYNKFPSKPAKRRLSAPDDIPPPKSQILPLDDKLWATQPKTPLRIPKGSFLILESREIDRYLVITPGILDIERVDRDHLKITPIKIGTTYIHVWDSRGRWTFNIQIIFPVQTVETKAEQPAVEQYAEPFKFIYSLDGGTLYRGSDIPSSERQNLNLQQTLGVVGDTPNGTVDGSVGFYKFDRTTEATNYTVGLTGFQGGGFTGVNVRGYDAVKYFSPLTFPGQYFRGILLEGRAMNDNIAAAYVHGQDRFTYSYVAPGVVEDRRSYVEGARVTLFPLEDNQYSINYARGYGDARQNYLNNQVYSIEAQHRIDAAIFRGELARSKDVYGQTLVSKFGEEPRTFYIHARDIDRDFTTITGLPSNRGEVGLDLGTNLDFDSFRLTSDFDFYRDKFLPNPDDREAINYDWNTAVSVPLGEATTFSSSVYYLDTPGELSPRKNFRVLNNLTRRFEVWGNRELQLMAGAAYHRNRLEETPIAEYDRYAATAGAQVRLIKHLNYFANYEYSWVRDLMTDEFSNPGVLNTGLNYATEITKKTSANVSFYYRDEQNTLGMNSFLAGEDSIIGGLGVSYRPTDNAELFIDSRVSNIWKENPDNPAYNEIDVRWGLRSAWDLPFTWNPSGTVHGIIFKDLNANGRRDPGEPRISGVRVKIGKREATSNDNGYYQLKLRAKSVMVAVNTTTVPTGYVLTTPPLFDVPIPNKKSIDFGFSTQSGIYGVVFSDRNNDNTPNEGDEFISRARIILDGKTVEESDYDGTYFFKDIESGKHNVRVDLNSLPIQYLPLIKLSNTIEVTEGTVYVFHVPVKKRLPADQSTTNETR